MNFLNIIFPKHHYKSFPLSFLLFASVCPRVLLPLFFSISVLMLLFLFVLYFSFSTPLLFSLFLSSPSFLLQNVLYCLRLSSVLFSSISSPSLHLSPAFGFTRLPRYSSISFSSCSSFSFAPLFRFLAYSFIKPPFRWPLMSPSLLKNSVALVNASA